jgi:hypothetical protein
MKHPFKLACIIKYSYWLVGVLLAAAILIYGNYILVTNFNEICTVTVLPPIKILGAFAFAVDLFVVFIGMIALYIWAEDNC